ncbi:MAG: GEVED domain-containing protein [Planctomycetota bacterium]
MQPIAIFPSAFASFGLASFVLASFGLAWAAPASAQACVPYCAASASSACCSNTGTLKEYISSVSIAGMTQSTNFGISCPGGYNGYRDYTNRIVNVAVGGTFTLTLGATVPNQPLCSTFTPFCRVWFDWDGDGVFATGEQTDVPRIGNTLVYATNITVPANAVDYTRMRVGSAWPGPPPPCGVIFNAASFQDFTVLVAGGAPAGRVVYGAGHPGTNGIPAIGASQVPSVGNAAFELEVSGAFPNSLGVLGVGDGQGATPLFGGTLLLDVNQTIHVLGAAIDAAGDGVVPVPLPNQPALLCSTFFCQWLVLDPGASQQFAFTPGLRLDIRE